jgi:diaminohydroxyphosphoribosylaminopyrimidine deaminase/5-amino-6-(5-phosphoribosylamino)uracil reductase
VNIQREEDNKFMRRCLDLAVRAEGMTRPNPLVGAVVVHKGEIIGEGFHIRAGGAHAEVFAIGSVEDRSLLKESVLYVSLEPCSHHGKTPPCTDLILESGIPRIVAGTTDTSEKVSGRGLGKLADAGREVVAGVLEDECRWVNRRFFTFNEKKRPYITLKWAQSADGFIDTERPEASGTGPYWISGKPERVLVHKWRSEEEAILVGAGTVRTDNPALNVRLWGGSDPLKIILSGSGNLKDYLTYKETIGTVIVFSSENIAAKGNETVVQLQDNEPAAVTICRYLFNSGIQSLFIEGGAMVLKHFIETGMWDEARIFTGLSGFGKGVKAPVIKGRKISVRDFLASRMEVLVNDLS